LTFKYCYDRLLLSRVMGLNPASNPKLSSTLIASNVEESGSLET
jgi:hypothetical protein